MRTTNESPSHRPRYGPGVGAALIAEAAFIIMMTAGAIVRGLDPWMPSRMAGALVLGPDAVRPAGFDALDVTVGLGLHAVMAVVVGVLFAVLLPRLRISALMGGVITGMLLYAFGFWILPLLFPSWLAPFRVPPLDKLLQAAAHLIYGAIFGAVYGRITRLS